MSDDFVKIIFWMERKQIPVRFTSPFLIVGKSMNKNSQFQLLNLLIIIFLLLALYHSLLINIF